MEPKTYYIYPNYELVLIRGISPYGKGWRYTPPRGSTIPALKQMSSLERVVRHVTHWANKEDIELPTGFGLKAKRKFEGIEIKKSSVCSRPRYYLNDTLHYPCITFHFDTGSMASFTSAITNAQKVLKLTEQLLGQECDCVFLPDPEKINESPAVNG